MKVQAGGHRLRAGPQLREHRADRPRRAAVPARARRGRADRRGDGRAREPRAQARRSRGAPSRSSARGSTRCAPRRTRRATPSARSRAARASNGCSATAPTRPATTARAEAAWRSALIGWERLMIEHLRRKNLGESAEAAVEVGPPALPAGPPRRGAAEVRRGDRGGRRSRSDVHRRGRLPRPARRDRRRRSASTTARCRARAARCRSTSRSTRRCGCWTCRGARASWPTPKAEAYLRTLDRRHGDLRPRRGAAWYHLLARYAVGQMTYEQMLAAADTTGKRAEIYFYEGMRRLGDGKSDDAHQLWQKVDRHAHVLVLRVRHGVALPARAAPTPPPPPATRSPSTATI